MKYKIYLDGKLFYQTDDYKDGLSNLLQSTITDEQTLEFFYDKFMMFRLEGADKLDFVKDGLKRIV